MVYNSRDKLHTQLVRLVHHTVTKRVAHVMQAVLSKECVDIQRIRGAAMCNILHTFAFKDCYSGLF
jgi:hypothetical protein